jgi:hypothetical protein
MLRHYSQWEAESNNEMLERCRGEINARLGEGWKNSAELEKGNGR